MLNPFAHDAWSLASLTDAINSTVPASRMVSERLGWNEVGVTSPAVLVDLKDGMLDIIDAAPFGGVPKEITGTDGRTKALTIYSHPAHSFVRPQEVNARRAFGTEADLETVELRRNEHVVQHLADHSITLEDGRIAALQGLVIGRDGAVVDNVGATLGRSNTLIGVDFTNVDIDYTDFFLNAADELAEAANDLAIEGWLAIAPRAKFRTITQSKRQKEKYRFWMQQTQNQDKRAGFEIAENVTLVQYSPNFAIPNGNRKAFPEDRVIMLPIAAGQYQTRFAPRQNNEFINTVGLPYYMESLPTRRNDGLDLWSESNWLNYVRRLEGIALIGQAGTGIWNA